MATYLAHDALRLPAASLLANSGLCVDIQGGPKNEATLHFREYPAIHFPKYLANYKKIIRLYDFCTHQGQCIVNMPIISEFMHFTV